MNDPVAVLTVFAFMAAFICAAGLSGWAFAMWERRKTKEHIEQVFDQLRKHLRTTR